MTKNLFNEQLAKGRPCEIAFREMAHKHWGRDNVYDYTNYEMWKDVQGKGIDFGITSEEWIDEVRVDVKGNFYFSEYNQCLQFDIEYSKWHPSKFNLHNSLIDVYVCFRCFYKLVYENDYNEHNPVFSRRYRILSSI